jgi:hypothetical protein
VKITGVKNNMEPNTGPVSLLHVECDSPHDYITKAKRDVDVIIGVLLGENSRLNNDLRRQVVEATTNLMTNIGHTAVVLSTLQAENLQLKFAMLDLKNQQNEVAVQKENTDERDRLPKIQSNDSPQLATNNIDPTTSERVKKHVQRSRREVITCRGDVDECLLTVPRKKHIHAFSFAPETTEDQIKTYMQKKDPDASKDIVVEKIVTARGTHASF